MLCGLQMCLLSYLQDQFDTLELSDNDVRKVDGFPLLRRLKCLILNNNRVALVPTSASLVVSLHCYFCHSFIHSFLYYSKCQNAFVVTNNIDILQLC